MKENIKKTDCVVLVCCIVFLIFVSGSVGRRGQELNKRMICSSNIKQLISGMTNYAYQHNGSFPTGANRLWPHDVEESVCRSILEYMGIKYPANQKIPVQDVFYCPTNYAQQSARSNHWNYYGYIVTGYAFLWYAQWNNNGQLPILGTGNKKWVSSIYSDPSETELVIDAIISQKRDYDPAIFPNGNFGRIYYLVSSPTNDSSSHLKTMTEPYGGNIGFVDGHVEWRPYNQMQLRHISSGTPGPLWWW